MERLSSSPERTSTRMDRRSMSEHRGQLGPQQSYDMITKGGSQHGQQCCQKASLSRRLSLNTWQCSYASSWHMKRRQSREPCVIGPEWEVGEDAKLTENEREARRAAWKGQVVVHADCMTIVQATSRAAPHCVTNSSMVGARSMKATMRYSVLSKLMLTRRRNRQTRKAGGITGRATMRPMK